MKKQITTFLAIILTITLSAQETTNLETSSDTAHYTLGAFVGKWMVNNGFSISDFEMFKMGMTDVQTGKELAIPDSAINSTVASYQLSIQSERSRQMETQLFADLRGKEGVGALPSGVHYIVIKAGTGARPTASDTVVMNVIGVFPDGTLFENSAEKEKPVQNVVSNLIPGLSEAVQIMPEGSKWRIFVPSALAYGTAGLPNVIPPNTALVFEITLEEVK
ncbi:MAG: FKBP-type peptidyl-prolyl cis-trans isomerase [Bacteroidales bacterium]